ATNINPAQLDSALVRLRAFEHLEYLAIGWTDLTRAQLGKLHDHHPRLFISCAYFEDMNYWNFPEHKQLDDVERSVEQGRFDEALAGLHDLTSSLDLRRPLLPIDLHAKLLELCVKIWGDAAEAAPDKARRHAIAEAAVKWADRVLSILPRN